jgi:hypothetical protein
MPADDKPAFAVFFGQAKIVLLDGHAAVPRPFYELGGASLEVR